MFSIAFVLATVFLAHTPQETASPEVSPFPIDPARGQRVDFTRGDTPADLGPVRLPVDPTSPTGEPQLGWSHLDFGAYFSSIPPYSTDPTYEVILSPPLSGNSTLAERFVVQVPDNLSAIAVEDRVLIVGFHSFSVSEKDVFLNTGLPDLCRDRGWILFAPFGLVDTNFGSPQTQESYEASLEFLDQFVPYDHDSVFYAGFSMGGLSALSFAMRHLDEHNPRAAGVVFHTGTLDMIDTYTNASSTVQALLASSTHFQASAVADPLAYARVSPVLFDGGGAVMPAVAPVLNLSHLNLWLHVNQADPNTNLVADFEGLRNFLTAEGVPFDLSEVTDGPGGHAWSTLDLTLALDTLVAAPRPGTPDAARLLIDSDQSFLAVRALERPSGERASVSYEKNPLGSPPGTLRLDGILGCGEVEVDLRELGFDPDQALRLEVVVAEPLDLNVRLTGLLRRPRSVSQAGVELADWRYLGGRTSLDMVLVGPGSYTIELQP